MASMSLIKEDFWPDLLVYAELEDNLKALITTRWNEWKTNPKWTEKLQSTLLGGDTSLGKPD